MVNNWLKTAKYAALSIVNNLMNYSRKMEIKPF